MNTMIDPRVQKVLQCPQCGGSPLEHDESGANCTACRAHFGFSEWHSLDLRLQEPAHRRIEVEIGSPLLPDPDFSFDVLRAKEAPEVDFGSVRTPHHMTRELLSHFPRARNSDSLALDLGCGDLIHREICRHAGFHHVGLDYASTAADFLGDAHSLPFADRSFEFVLSIAVLEHLQHPTVAMAEALRVLEPGGVFVGTVAFLEPFHSDSIYHHSHLGTVNSLHSAGFEIDIVAPSREWHALAALASMGLFPMMPAGLTKLLVLPLQAAHRIWWSIGRRIKPRASENFRVLSTTGAFSFVARRPLD